MKCQNQGFHCLWLKRRLRHRKVRARRWKPTTGPSSQRLLEESRFRSRLVTAQNMRRCRHVGVQGYCDRGVRMSPRCFVSCFSVKYHFSCSVQSSILWCVQAYIVDEGCSVFVPRMSRSDAAQEQTHSAMLPCPFFFLPFNRCMSELGADLTIHEKPRLMEHDHHIVGTLRRLRGSPNVALLFTRFHNVVAKTTCCCGLAVAPQQQAVCYCRHRWIIGIFTDAPNKKTKTANVVKRRVLGSRYSRGPFGACGSCRDQNKPDGVLVLDGHAG